MNSRGVDELRHQLLLWRSPGTGQRTTSPRGLHGDGGGGGRYVRGREERKRRVRNEWMKRNLILIGRKLLSAMTTNGARHTPVMRA
jgi:hypothetical protein